MSDVHVLANGDHCLTADDGRTLTIAASVPEPDRVKQIAGFFGPPAIVVPDQVPMWAAQAALKQNGRYDAINRAIVGDASANPPVLSMESTNPPVYFAWTMGNYASRKSIFIDALAQQFGMSSSDIDAVFLAAEQIAKVAG